MPGHDTGFVLMPKKEPRNLEQLCQRVWGCCSDGGVLAQYTQNPKFDSQHWINRAEPFTTATPALLSVGPRVHGHTQLCNKCEDSLGYVRPCLKNYVSLI